MKDREDNQIQEVQLPPLWCSSICRNAMSEICVEQCAIERDCSKFEAKPNLKLEDMPKFPETAGMTKEEKFTSVTIYLSKVVDHLQGKETNEPINIPIRRPSSNYSRSSALPENFKVKDLLFGVQEGNPTPQDRAECPDSPDGFSEVDGNTS